MNGHSVLIIIILYVELNLCRPGNASQPIWLDDVVCGLEPQDCITNCKQCPSDRYQHNCVHGKDLTISCSELRITRHCWGEPL